MLKLTNLSGKTEYIEDMEVRLAIQAVWNAYAKNNNHKLTQKALDVAHKVLCAVAHGKVDKYTHQNEHRGGDRALVDTATITDGKAFVEMDGLHYDSDDYGSYVEMLQAIADRARDVALGNAH